MRIAFVNNSRRKVGGVEAYIDSVAMALAEAGHEIGWLYESDIAPAGREAIRFPKDAPQWSTDDLGLSAATEKLESWKPDLCYCHGLRNPALEATIVRSLPSALYVHCYYGTCISGNKLHSTATPALCERRFGLACLAHYFPHKCGGNNPLTMWQMFRMQSRRLDSMRNYRALITNSDHMVKELRRHGLQSERVYPPFVPHTEVSPQSATPGDELRLMFAARMTSLKGGQYLLAALPEVQRKLGKKLFVTFAGDGPDRPKWERTSAGIRSNNIYIEFPGWLSSEEMRLKLASAHLLVFPSVWPEPFGFSGIEAGLHGVPTVAFAVGGIPEWLHDGVNGHLAEVGTRTLAEGIHRCLADPEHYSKLRAGACRRSREYPLNRHISELLAIFERCVR